MYRYCFDDPLIFDIVVNIMFVFTKKDQGYRFKYDQQELDYTFLYDNGTYIYDLRKNGFLLLASIFVINSVAKYPKIFFPFF